VLYYNTDPQRQIVREHTDQMAHEMRRARCLTSDEAGCPGWGRLAAELIGRAPSLRRRKWSRDPLYDV
jgi:hypothetical protein